MICPKCRHKNQDGLDSCFKCGESFVAAITVREGTLIAGHYEIRAPLGKGGMGMVYMAFDRTLEETVAIKLLRPDAALNADIARRFRTEIKLARRITHRNVCRIYEYGEDQGHRYICMEYVEGTNLRQILTQRGGLPLDEALEIAIQVAQGLEAIHEVGVVHRDLKTANIMRDPRGVVRLMDFGIAKQLGPDSSSGATATGMIVGTPDYMSPEQARGGTVDLRSDIYSLGIVLYELLTGELPFRAETPVATILKQIHEDPRLDRPGIPTSLTPLLRRAMQKDPAERYSSARTVVEALIEARANHSTSAAARAAPTSPALPGPPRTTPPPARSVTAPLPGTPRPTVRPVASPEAPRRPSPPTHPSPAGATVPMPTPAPRVRTPPPATPRAAMRIGLWIAPAAVITALMLAVGAYVIWSQLLSTPRTTVADGITGTSIPSAAPRASAEPRRLATPTPAQTPPPAATPAPRPTLAAASTPTPQPNTVPMPAPTREPARPVLVLGGGSSGPPAASATASPTPTPAPTPLAKPVATPAPTPQPAPVAAPPPVPVARGALHITVLPWADVAVDGASVGRTSNAEIPLTPGAHVVRFIHPDYQPLQRKVSIVADKKTPLVIDLAEDGIPKR